jgi:two-component system, cell cycle sensor histidine kinase and response regulator CckA
MKGPDPIPYRELFDAAGVGIYASRPDGTLIWCNPAFVRILGFASVDEALSVNTSTIYASPAQRTAWIDTMRRHQNTGQLRVRLRRRDGQQLQVLSEVTPLFDPDGSLAEIRGFFMDVTGSADKQDALRAKSEQFHSVFLGAADAMFILDDERGILDANRAAAALFGQEIGALVGRAFDELLVNDRQELEHAWREVMALGEAKRSHRALSPAKGVRVVECSYRAAVYAGRHLCIASDVTDREALEQRLLQSEKMESVGRLAGGIAHDFNNLLTAILGYTELLLANHETGDPDHADLEEIQKAGLRAAALTQQLLAYSRKQMLSPKKVDINQTVAGLRGMLTRLIREDITLTCVPSSEPSVVRIDPTQLEQVIVNLVLNARDALPGGGAIELEVARVKASDVELPSDLTMHVDEYVRLRVMDNGVGIPAEAKPHLFEPFFTTKAIGKGTGLGLASVYGIVRQSNGFISVESDPGVRTAFTMHFPAVASADPVQQDAAEVPEPGGQETILLVEDEDAVRVIVAAVLRRQGYSVLEASSPGVAVELFEQHGPSIELLLTDVVMPGMNGPSLAQRLVATRPSLRILFMSGYADVSSPLDAAGPNVSFLSKPFQASALAAKVREVLSASRRAG